MLALIQKYWVAILAASLLGNIATTTIIVRERIVEKKSDCYLTKEEYQKKRAKIFGLGDRKVIFGDSHKF